MRKIKLLILISVGIILISTKVDNDKKILWSSSRQLKFEDFQGCPDSIDEYKARTFVVINSYFSRKKNSIIIYVKTPCYFFINNSWMKIKDESLLKHEQLHFDIAEYIAREMRREHQNLIYNKNNSFEEVVDSLISVTDVWYDLKLDSINALYDLETNHGLIKSEQKKWEKMINLKLKKLKSYSKVNYYIKPKNR